MDLPSPCAPRGARDMVEGSRTRNLRRPDLGRRAPGIGCARRSAGEFELPGYSTAEPLRRISFRARRSLLGLPEARPPLENLGEIAQYGPLRLVAGGAERLPCGAEALQGSRGAQRSGLGRFPATSVCRRGS